MRREIDADDVENEISEEERGRGTSEGEVLPADREPEGGATQPRPVPSGRTSVLDPL